MADDNTYNLRKDRKPSLFLCLSIQISKFVLSLLYFWVGHTPTQIPACLPRENFLAAPLVDLFYVNINAHYTPSIGCKNILFLYQLFCRFIFVK